MSVLETMGIGSVRKAILAATVGMVAFCARAEAAVYNAFQTVSFARSDTETLIATVFAPLFDRTLGTLNKLSFSLSGVATEVVSYYQNTPPSRGTFLNTVQFNNDRPIVLSTGFFDQNSFTSPTTFGETFGVVALVSYPPSYIQPTDTSIALSLIVDGIPQPTTCCAYTSVRFLGSLATIYDYTPVPEPSGAILLTLPALATVAARRRSLYLRRPRANTEHHSLA